MSVDRTASAPPPRLVHSLHQKNTSILCISTSRNHIFSASQYDHISVRPCYFVDFVSLWMSDQVWSKDTFTLKSTLRGHTKSVLALENAEDKNWLFSSSGKKCISFLCFWTYVSSGDSTVRVC